MGGSRVALLPNHVIVRGIVGVGGGAGGGFAGPAKSDSVALRGFAMPRNRKHTNQAKLVSQQLQAAGALEGLDAVVHVELSVDMFDMCAYGVWRNDQQIGDLLN